MRFLSALSVAFLLLLSTSGVAYAAALPDNASDQEITDAGYLTDDEIAEAVGDPDDVPMVYDPDGNLVSGPAVQLAEADLKYAPYIGSGWITGTASGLGEVYIYVPISSRGSWGTTSDGYLCNVGGNSVSGVLYTKAGTRYTFHFNFPERSAIFIDEVSLIWDNRNFKNMDPKVVEWFRYQRHHKCRVYLFSQSFDIDKKLRDLCDEMYIVGKFARVLVRAKRIIRKPVVVHPSPEAPARIDEDLIVDGPLMAFFGGRIYAWIPYWAKTFNSFKKV